MPSSFERALVGDLRPYERGTGLWLAASARAAAASRLGRLLTGALVLTATAAHAPRALLLAPVLLVLVVVASLVDGRVRRAACAAGRAGPIRLPHPVTFHDGRAKALATRLALARGVIRRVVRWGPRGVGFDLRGLLGRAAQLERDAVVLLSRFDFLARVVLEPAQAREARADLAGEEDERGAALVALGVETESVLSAAEQAVGTLEAIPIAMLRLQLKRLDACDDRTCEARRRSASLLADLEALSGVLDDEAPPERYSSIAR